MDPTTQAILLAAGGAILTWAAHRFWPGLFGLQLAAPATPPAGPVAPPPSTGHPILDAARAILAQATPANLAAALAALQQLIAAHQAQTPPAPPK